MSTLGHLAHFENFARLHRATHADLPSLEAFSDCLPKDMSKDALCWQRWVSDRHAYVLMAQECQIVVGVCVVCHKPSTPLAALAWIGVQSAARGRGLGSMMLGNAIGHARSEGAAKMVAEGVDEDSGLHALLLDSGFVADAGTHYLSLWNDRRAPSYGEFFIPPHQPTEDCDTSVCGLLLAMGTLDGSMLLTARADRELQKEVDRDSTEQGKVMALVRAAIRRRFSVVVLGAGPAQETRLDYASTEWIRFDEDLLTPERLVGHLSRLHLPLVHLHFSRLAKDAAPRWYLVTGFDGYLFRLVDVAGQGAGETTSVAVTAPEMRQALCVTPGMIGITVARVI